MGGIYLKIGAIVLILTGLLFFNIDGFCKDYSCEREGDYVYHLFGFDVDEIREMAKGPYKATGFGDWMIDKIKGAGKDMSVALLEVTRKAILDFKLTSMARIREREGENILEVKMRTYDKGSSYWSVEFYDSMAKCWKELTDK